MRGATAGRIPPSGVPGFQSTLLMRGATLSLALLFDGFGISIHAPHARSDGYDGYG